MRGLVAWAAVLLVLASPVSCADETESAQDYYSVLNVSKGVTGGELKKAFHVAALRWHPDKNLDNADAATEMMLRINAAYKRGPIQRPRSCKWKWCNME